MRGVEALLSRVIQLVCSPAPLEPETMRELLDIARSLEQITPRANPSRETLEAEHERETRSPLSPLERARILDLRAKETTSNDIYRLLVLSKAHVASDPPLARRLALQVLIAFHAFEMKTDRTLVGAFTQRYRKNLERIARAIDREALAVESRVTL